jgi:glycosyltransferase involved in cell wall biosynthesis
VKATVVALDGLLLGGRHTGVENAILNLARALREDPGGCDVHITVPAGPTADELDGGGLRVHRVGAGRRGRLRRILWEQTRLPRFARSVGANVLHCPGYVMPVRYRGPSVLTVYDVLALQRPQWCARLNVAHYRALMPASIRNASVVVAPAQAVKDDLLEAVPVPPEKVRVVPLGVSPEYRRVTDEEQRAEVRKRHELPARFILTVGNIEPKKNLGGMVEAYDGIAADCPADLVIAGGVGWRCEATLAALAKAKHKRRIHCLGYVPQDDMPTLLSLADALVQWSLYEGFGLPPLEAMNCGTPVIVSDGGALPEVVGDAGVVAPLADGSAGLGEAIARLLGDKALRRGYTERGIERAAQFTWRRHAGIVTGLYREVAGAV